MGARGVDFDYVKSLVSWEELLAHYGLLDDATRRETAKGVELRLHCPFHEDRQPSFSVNLATGLFNCFGCSAKGYDLYDFVVLKQGIGTEDKKRGRYEAACLVAEWFGVESPRSTKRRARKQSEPVAEAVNEAVATAADEREESQAEDASGKPVNPPLQFVFKHLDQRHPYLKKRGLSEETIEVFGLGYHAGKGIMSGRVVIPIHNEVGELIAYAGRWPGDEGWPEGEDKYKLPQGFHKSLVLFNLHRAREHAGAGLIVVEGFFAVFEFWQRGRKNVVALMGSTMSAEQERLIVQMVGPRGRVLLALDGDEAGTKGSADAVSRLVSRVFVRTMAL
jgi:DNA primase